MLPIALFDDNRAHSDMLGALLSQIIERGALNARVALSAESADELIAFAREHAGACLYLLDIELEREYTGVDLWRDIQKHNPEAYCIYVSAYPHHAMSCLRSHAFDFLLKPYTVESLESCVRAAVEDMSAKKIDMPLQIWLGSRTVMLDQKEIVSLVSSRNFVVAQVGARVYKWRDTIKDSLTRLDGDRFLQISRSCIVGILHIAEADWNEDVIVTTNDARHKISRRFRSAVKTRLQMLGN